MSKACRIEEALRDALDCISGEEEYADARRELLAACSTLNGGTTAQVQAHLDEGLRLIDAVCPL